ncbi:MAG: type II toxin-antitoxin system VapC family toxin [Thauera sp.]|nr:type II toxin-antitoxin system VapC family toxin [Thauera sp.]
MLRVLLDTNIVIYVIKRRPLSALKLFNEHAGQMAISSITLAELFHGAEKSNAPARSLAAVEDFCSRLEVLAYGPKAAHHYGAIRTALEKRGTPIGVNDLHIAAHARSEGLTLVSNNTREFERVDGLLLANWVLDDAA